MLPSESERWSAGNVLYPISYPIAFKLSLALVSGHAHNTLEFLSNY